MKPDPSPTRAPSGAAPGSGAVEGLAVIIPAFKAGHLGETLAAFAAQTSGRFRLYVADDASPEDLAAVVMPFRDRLDLVYHRFPVNRGRASLSGHWDRAIALSEERWVWLFSDDDSVSPDCVAAFWEARARRPGAAGLHRFQCEFIGPDGRPVPGCRLFRYPERQSWEEHARAITMRDRQYVTIVQNVIFPRELYQRHGGFADYPLGLWSDHITWARFAGDEGFLTLPGGLVSYRVHPSSIGGALFCAGGDRSELLLAAGRMFADLRALFAERGGRPPDLAFLAWLARLFRYSPFPLSAAERAAAARALRTGWPRWPLIREAVFWWHAGRPILKRHGWLRGAAGLGARVKTRCAGAPRPLPPFPDGAADPVFCLYEDRPDCEEGVRLALASLRRNHPAARAVLFTPGTSPALREWLSGKPGFEWRRLDANGSGGWDCKCICLLQLLGGGERNVVWLDSDLIVTGDLIAWIRSQPDNALVVAEDPRHLPDRGTRNRALAWSRAPGTERGFTVNTCVIRVTQEHRALLEAWREMLADPAYRRAQREQHHLDRPFHLASDQDSLGALLGSGKQAGTKVAVLRSGREIVHCGGLRMDSLASRLGRLAGPPALCLHAIALKPWHLLPPRPEQRNLSWRLLQLGQEVSEYTAQARRLRGEIGLPCAWMDHRTAAGSALRALALGSGTLRGVIFAAAVSLAHAAGLGRRTKSAIPWDPARPAPQ